MKIREYELAVDVLEELECFNWGTVDIKGDKFITCSPFRVEHHPSFAVNLVSGLWIDSGNTDEQFHKGNLVKLIALLRNEEYTTVEDYLVEKYATILKDTDALKLHINLYGEQDKPLVINKNAIKHLYKYRHNYLDNRGISEEIQRLFGIGYNPENNAVALPWLDKKGNIVNIKYRRVDTKAFFYEKGGQPIKNHVYGLYQCILKRAKRIFLCESEIDALTLWTHGYCAIAIGGSTLTNEQKQLILNSGTEELVICTDNDSVGNKLRERLKGVFGGDLRLLDFYFPKEVKDVNEMSKEQLSNAVENLENTTFSFIQHIY